MEKRLNSSAVLRELIGSINYRLAIEEITSCLKGYVDSSGSSGLVIGLSGGLDSSVAAALAVRAVGPEHVTALIMPEKESPIGDVEDALEVARSLRLNYLVLNITGLVEETLKLFGKTYETSEDKARGNVKARLRMVCLYYYANANNYLVVATSNRSEFLLGYFTKWGDGSGDIYPLLSLYKSQVRQLGRVLGLPHRVLDKPSSPALWPGQTAQQELGLSYDVIDAALYLLVDKQMSIGEVSALLGLEEGEVSRLWRRVLESEHKRSPLKSCPLSFSRVLTEVD
ncbi:MAG: NAD+ synthase [Fervidicoccaceae archaeon]